MILGLIENYGKAFKLDEKSIFPAKGAIFVYAVMPQFWTTPIWGMKIAYLIVKCRLLTTPTWFIGDHCI